MNLRATSLHHIQQLQTRAVSLTCPINLLRFADERDVPCAAIVSRHGPMVGTSARSANERG